MLVELLGAFITRAFGSFWELLLGYCEFLLAFGSRAFPPCRLTATASHVGKRALSRAGRARCTRQPNTLPRAGCRLLLRSEVRCSHSAFPTTLAATALAAGSAAFAFTDAAARDAAAPLRAAALTAAVSALVAADHAPALLRPDALQAYV